MLPRGMGSWMPSMVPRSPPSSFVVCWSLLWLASQRDHSWAWAWQASTSGHLLSSACNIEWRRRLTGARMEDPLHFSVSLTTWIPLSENCTSFSMGIQPLQQRRNHAPAASNLWRCGNWSKIWGKTWGILAVHWVLWNRVWMNCSGYSSTPALPCLTL